MKKTTLIAFIVTLIYCSFATYVLLFEVGMDPKIIEPTFPEWFENSLLLGGVLGLAIGYSIGYMGLWIGQIINFIILFFLLKSFLNWITNKLKKQKN